MTPEHCNWQAILTMVLGIQTTFKGPTSANQSTQPVALEGWELVSVMVLQQEWCHKVAHLSVEAKKGVLVTWMTQE